MVAITLLKLVPVLSEAVTLVCFVLVLGTLLRAAFRRASPFRRLNWAGFRYRVCSHPVRSFDQAVQDGKCEKNKKIQKRYCKKRKDMV